MEIFTDAPIREDLFGTIQVGELGQLRIVSVEGDRSKAEAQVLRYRDRGHFVTEKRLEAVRFVTSTQNFGRPAESVVFRKWEGGGVRSPADTDDP